MLKLYFGKCLFGFFLFGLSHMLYASESAEKFLPLIFGAESKAVKTTACIKIKENLYGNSKWWETQYAGGTSADIAFRKVITAIKRGDQQGLFQLSHSAEGRDSQQFDQQAKAYFKQLKISEIITVPVAYELEGLVAFYARIKIGGGFIYAPFLFLKESNGGYGFLPYRTHKIGFGLLDYWFNSTWGYGVSENPEYCSSDQIDAANIKIELSSKPNDLPFQLFVKGFSTNVQKLGKNDKIEINKIELFFNKLKSVNSNKGLDLYRGYFSSKGFEKIQEWYLSLSSDEKKIVFPLFFDHTPIYVINANPIFIVYTKTAKGLDVIYLDDSGKKIVWVNSSHITIFDSLFKRGPVFDKLSSIMNP